EELGESSDEDEEVEQLRERLALLNLPDEARQAARKQLKRLASMPAQASEYQVARSYVEWILDLPWQQSTPDHMDVQAIRRCLDEDHYGLEDVKKRIIEFAAVRQLRKDNRSPILLFIGPPGVGKTSLGKSIARAMGRHYSRIALGGVRDEAEIRGHRRTYVGALPGRIIQALKKTASNNPVLVLDEIDKMGVDMRGDPGAALLEVLDPAQNNSFVDHYLDLPFDLSKVTFLATANYWKGIPEALADRLEVIEVPGYTPQEKREIARRFLLPKQIRENGLTESDVVITDEVLDLIREGYTREAGVRGLERELGSVCRAVAVEHAQGEKKVDAVITPERLEAIKGAPRYRVEQREKKLHPGVALGLGASDVGGEVLNVEVSKMPGKGNIRLTGSLGPVLEEAANTAFTFVRSKSTALHLEEDWLKNIDLHLHIPLAQAVYDFAGLGASIFGALASLLLNSPCRADTAIVGELTLRGRVLGVRNLKPMLFAAHRLGIKTVILPSKNRPDIQEVPEEILHALDLKYIDRVDQILPLLLDNNGPDEHSSNETSATL
ncbi:MAG: endopeptidase La, partial [Polyangiaceae bacterium]|nr:endopeptidase La [Polyangiaceae bacterium]